VSLGRRGLRDQKETPDEREFGNMGKQKSTCSDGRRIVAGGIVVEAAYSEQEQLHSIPKLS